MNPYLLYICLCDRSREWMRQKGDDTGLSVDGGYLNRIVHIIERLYE